MATKRAAPRKKPPARAPSKPRPSKPAKAPPVRPRRVAVRSPPPAPAPLPPAPAEPTHWLPVDEAPIAAEPLYAPLRAPSPPPQLGRRLEGVPMSSGRGVVAILLLAVLFLFLALLAIPGIIQLVQGGDEPELELTAGSLWLNVAAQVLIFFLIPVGYVRLVRPGIPAYRSLGLVADRRTFLHVGLGLGAAVLLFLGLGLILYGLQQAGLFSEPQSPLIGEIGKLVRAHPEFVLVIPLAAGITEEVLFRGLLQPRIGFVASNLLFGLTHAAYGTTLQIVLPFLVGFLFGYLYKRTGRLWAPIAAHTGFDVIQMVLLLVDPAAEAAPAIGFF